MWAGTGPLPSTDPSLPNYRVEVCRSFDLYVLEFFFLIFKPCDLWDLISIRLNPGTLQWQRRILTIVHQGIPKIYILWMASIDRRNKVGYFFILNASSVSSILATGSRVKKKARRNHLHLLMRFPVASLRCLHVAFQADSNFFPISSQSDYGFQRCGSMASIIEIQQSPSMMKLKYKSFHRLRMNLWLLGGRVKGKG